MSSSSNSNSRKNSSTKKESKPYQIPQRRRNDRRVPQADDRSGTKICFSWQASGACRFGDSCRFNHPAPEEPFSATLDVSSPRSSQLSTEVAQFISRLSSMIAKSKSAIFLNNPRDLELWKNAWRAASTGSADQASSDLLQMYMRLPATSQCAPEPQAVWGTILRALSTAKTNNIIQVAQVTADVVEHRLLPQPTNIHCLEAISELRLLVPTVLAPAAATSRTVAQASRLLAHLLMMMGRAAISVEKVLNSKAADYFNTDATAAGKVWMGWQKPTVSWLQNGKWLVAPYFTSSYDSLESYIETIRRTMVMLTFYWGAGALFPKCKFKKGTAQDGAICNQPLCAPGGKGQQVFCDRKRRDGSQCRQAAVWKCHFNGHDGICSRCITSLQTILTGNPGRHASTDIYDATVDRETHRRDGHVYICSQVISRKPPEKGVNWRTTYRLKCAALVGVVRIAFTGQPLNSEMTVEWAEIVPLNTGKGYKEDFHARQSGCLALRLLTRSDLSLLKTDSEGLPVGGKVALIDMQVFIPEVIPVLAAISDPDLEQHLQAIKFSSHLTGASSESLENFFGSDTRMMIQQALENSSIELVSRVTDREALTNSISSLAMDTKLDGTQFSAFCGALANGLHCTQGPPGTGKSYLGVAIIRALDTIRTFARLSNVSVGPIVVLAYKNHALDEILLDVLKSEYFSRRGELIRCGMPEKEELKRHIEWRSEEEERAGKLLDKRISSMRAFRRALRDLKTFQSALCDPTGEVIRFWDPSEERSNPEASCFDLAAEWMMRLLLLYSRVRDLSKSPPKASRAFDIMLDFLSSAEDVLIHVDGCFQPATGIIQKFIDHLDRGNEHWLSDDGSSRIKFLVSKWLSGDKPPPHCFAYNEEACPFAVRIEGQYCKELHSCLYDEGCALKREEKIPFCSSHRCSFGSTEMISEACICPHPRMHRSQTCKLHSCPLCISFGCAVINRKIVVACECHSCQYDGCNSKICSLAVPFCKEHACVACIYYSHNQPESVESLVRVEGSRFCVDHKCRCQNCDKNRAIVDEISQDFCIDHCCRICTGKRQMVSSDTPKTRLCTYHRCLYSLDIRCTRVRTGSLFCDDHTCRICKSKGFPLDKRVEDDPPRNVCCDHRLCSHQLPTGETCSNEVPEADLVFCKEHSARNRYEKLDYKASVPTMQCEGTSRKKKRCGTRGPCLKQPFYCLDHLNQRPISDEDSLPSTEDDREEAERSSEEDNFEDLELEDKFEHFGSDTERNFLSGDLVENPAVTEVGPDVPKNISGSFFASDGDGRNTPSTLEARCDNSKESLGLKSELEEHSSFRIVEDVYKKEKQHSPEKMAQNSLSSTEQLFEKTGVVQIEEHIVSIDNTNDNLLSSSEDEGIDKPGNDMPLDELDTCDSEIPDNMQHLHEIADYNYATESSSDEEETRAIPGAKSDNEVEDITEADPSKWFWKSSKQERWELARLFVTHSISSIEKMIICAEEHVDEARKTLAETSASSLKRARVIGATVVGATRRLHAIRASEPFAMVVEEACEVMEPTLLSVMAVRSLQKLELIGDHRQLPAFIHQCWFNAQLTNPSLQISLFERLVEHESSPLTVLDVQRRMRSEICDLTRDEYKDVISIKDDPCTRSQLVADRILKECLGRSRTGMTIKLERNLWMDDGMLVPGVVPQVYFWDLDSEEGKAAVGVSRCNEKEANCCVALARWLVTCGVPAKAITLITPYKGQVMTILKKFRAEKWYEKGAVYVSSVDRYQGDENDIVILSLVSTKPGNRFVAFRNRFIVAASRARIGFYIVGNSEAVTKGAGGANGPRHWQRLLNDLGTSTSTDGSRIGKAMEICCPRHRKITKKVSAAKDFPSGNTIQNFCKEPCSFQLQWCGHRCNLQCHSAALPHRRDCEEVVDRCCEKHADIPLKCHVVFKHFSGNLRPDFDAALTDYRCEVLVEYRRPECSHVIPLQCEDYEEVLRGTKVLHECDAIVADFVHPSCGHVFSKPKCCRRQKWEASPPTCKVTVDHERQCGCKLTLPCGDALKEMALGAPPTCNVAVIKPRPRCSHPLSCRCNEMTRLIQLWDEGEGDGVTGSDPVVYHGTEYGPSETELGAQFQKDIMECMVKTKYSQSCGHITTLRCTDAFSAAAGEKDEAPCTELTEGTNPLCGHVVDISCYLKKFISTVPSSLFVEKYHEEMASLEMMASEQMLLSAQQPHARLRKVSGSCKQHVFFERECGHTSNPIPCTSIFSILSKKKLPDCKALVELDRECQHKFRTECSKSAEPIPKCEAPVDDVFVYPLCLNGHSIRPGICRKLTELRALDDPPCPVELSCTRPRCHHTVKVACHLENTVNQDMLGDCATVIGDLTVVEEGKEYRKSEMGVKDCTESVLFLRECGHEVQNVPCSTAFKWVAFPDDKPPCRNTVTIASPLCGHDVEVQCSKASEIENTLVWQNGKPDRVTELVGSSDNIAFTPVVTKEDGAPIWSSEISNLQCGFFARYERECGHVENIPCSGIFNAIKSSCQHVINFNCEDCGQVRRVKCVEEANVSTIPCRNTVKKVCSLCGINSKKVECFVEKVVCEEKVNTTRECGHLVSWICGEENDPRASEAPCIQCKLALWKDALGRIKDAADGAANGRALVYDVDGSFVEALHLKQKLQKRVREELAFSEFNIDEVSNADTAIRAENIQDALVEMLRGYVDVLSLAVDNRHSADKVEFKDLLHVQDVDKSYDFVFLVEKEHIKFPNVFHSRKTNYGRGFQAMVLNAESLKEMASENSAGDGSLRIYVAAVLRLLGCKGLSPFSHHVDARRRKKQKKGMKIPGNESVLKMSEQRARGYDHVDVQPSKNEKHPSVLQRVYWVPGAVVPLCRMKLTITVQCGICMTLMLPQKGWFCKYEHFLCRECFNLHVQHASQPDALQRSIDEKGNVKCPHDGCNSVYDPLLLVTQKHDASAEELMEMHNGLQIIRMALHSKEEVAAALEVQKQMMQAEFDRINSIKDREEREAERVKVDVVDKILTLRCPNKDCRMAFLDFSGCFAVNCHSCKSRFCAWCLDHWTTGDVHGHVANCTKSLRRGELFGNEADFKQVQINWKKERVVRRLNEVSEKEIRIKALNALRYDLSSVGVQIFDREVNL